MGDTAAAVSAWESLFRAQVSVMRLLSAEFPTGEISFNEYDVLFNISREPESRLRLRALNEHVLLAQPSVSRLVDRLAAKGLVHKEPDPGDGRGTLVMMTEKGHATFRRVAVVHMESIARRVGDALDPEELCRLEALCDKLRHEEK